MLQVKLGYTCLELVGYGKIAKKPAADLKVQAKIVPKPCRAFQGEGNITPEPAATNR